MKLFVWTVIIGGLMAIVGGLIIQKAKKVRARATPEKDPGILTTPGNAAGALTCFCDVAQRLDESMISCDENGSGSLSGEYEIGGFGSVKFRYYMDTGILDWVLGQWGIELPVDNSERRDGWYLGGIDNYDRIIYVNKSVQGYPEWIGLDPRAIEYLDYELIKKSWHDDIERIVHTHWKNAQIEDLMVNVSSDHRLFQFFVSLKTYPIKTIQANR